jgi:uncharacterized protein (DUF2141 family)
MGKRAFMVAKAAHVEFVGHEVYAGDLACSACTDIAMSFPFDEPLEFRDACIETLREAYIARDTKRTKAHLYAVAFEQDVDLDIDMTTWRAFVRAYTWPARHARKSQKIQARRKTRK